MLPYHHTEPLTLSPSGLASRTLKRTANVLRLTSAVWWRALALLVVTLGVLGCSRQEAAPSEPVRIARQSFDAAQWPVASLVATNSVAVGSGARVDGNIDVINAASGAVLNGTGVELGLSPAAVVAGNVRADTLSLGSASSISGGAGYNTKTGTGTISGPLTTPITLPLPITLPALPTITPNTTNLTINAGATQTLVAGVRNNVTVGAAGRLNLSGGVYHFRALTVNASGQVRCQAACEVRVLQTVSLQPSAILGPADATVPLAQVQLIVAGASATPSTTPGVVALSTSALIEGYVFAPNGTVRVEASATLRGKIAARDVFFGASSREDGVPLPVITQEPSDLALNAGTQAVFTVVATGPNLGYQWLRNGTSIAGATSATLSFVSQSADNGAGFSVRVTNLAGSVTSRTALLTVRTCTATDTTCNGVDDDCNGQADEDYVAAPTSCGVGACAAAGTRSCVGGVEVDSCHPGTPALNDATCNGIDDDCSGQTDEDFAPATTSCGTGACGSTGTTSCVNGAVADSCTPGVPAANDATCNGVDDDCSGQVDEDFVPSATSCGTGACAATGVTSCVSGSVVNGCTPGTPAANDATCNGVDDDCNGQIDEDYTPVVTSCGTGACAATGATSCTNGAVTGGCTPGTPAANDATCNGVDDDCNGQIDEDYTPVATSCGTGACAATGATSCANGAVTNGCSPGSPAASDTSCDGVDDDCNGQTDEDYVSVSTSCGASSCAATGATSCVNGAVVDSCTPGTPAANDASCDGIDNDCDGPIDEGFVPAATTCGLGACAATGVTSCVNGIETNSCHPGTAAANDATCNGIDDDCDGQVDEDFVSTATNCGIGACAAAGVTSCVNGSTTNSCAPGTPAASDATCNGVDDDCNGQVDEDFAPAPTSCGVGACAATGATSCVNGSVTNGCSPGTPAASDATCNGVDDDCNGQVDEDFVSAVTSCGTGACASIGATSCVNGTVRNSCSPGSPAASDATCNGIDDDCNGQLDEDFVSGATSCGIGACAATGATSCVNGSIVNSCSPGSPAADDATCDGFDDDCDGQDDEDFVSTATSCGVGACASSGATACVNGSISNGCTPGAPAASDATCNGVDDDCNGANDEDFVASCSGTQARRCQSGQLLTTECSDDNVCTGAETCTGEALCQPGTPLVTDDQNPCTSDSCDPSSGVAHTPVSNGVSCGPGRVCDGQGACVVQFAVPVIEQQPSNASVAVGAAFNFTVVASGTNLSYQWQRFGTNIAGATASTYSGVAEYSDGGGIYRVIVSNPGGTVTSNGATLNVVDAAPPSLTLDGPSELNTPVDTLTVRGTATDGASGLDRVFVTSNHYAGQSFGVVVGETGAFQGEVPLRSGANQLTVVAIDRAGNRAELPIAATLVVQAIPIVRIGAPAHGSIVTTDTVTVTGTVSSSLPAEEIRLRLGSALTFPTGTNGEYSFAFEGVRLSPGANTLTVTAETDRGNASATSVVTLQSGSGGGVLVPPQIEIANLQPDTFVSSAVLPINGTVSAQTCVQSVEVNGVAAILTGAGASVSFSSTLTIPRTDGSPFEITVVATDCAAQLASLRFVVRYDDVKPTVAVESLAAEPAVNGFTGSPVRVRGVLTERNPASLSVGSQSLGITPGSSADQWRFEFDAPLVRGDVNRLTIDTVDRAGNREQVSFLLRLDATVDIQVLAPSEGTEYLGGQGAVSIDVLARVPGLAPGDRVFARVDAGARVLLARSGDLARGALTTASATAEHSVSFEAESSDGTVLATRSVRVSVVDPSSIPLALAQHFPANGATQIEANESIVLEFNRPITPELLEVSVVETVHGRTYEHPTAGADLTTLSDVKQVDVNREQEPVPGGLSFLPGNRNVSFYPRRDYGYGGSVTVTIRHDGTELRRFGFSVRELPTLVYGFVTDQSTKPLEDVEVQLKELGLSTLTDASGYFSFGFGKAADAIPGGRYRLEVNPGWRNRGLTQNEAWINAQASRLSSLGVLRLPRLSEDLPITEIRSGQADLRLAGGDLELDLSNAALTFADGRSAAEGLALALSARSIPYRAVPFAVPHFGYLIQPGGITLSGSLGVTVKLASREGGYEYLSAFPEWVLLIGLDPSALELVPIGVGRIDKVRYVIESRGELQPGRLDFIGFQVGAAPQASLEAYASGAIDLTRLISDVAGAER